MSIAFLHGFILSLGLILPLGMQNVFVFTQGVTQPRLSRLLLVIVTAALCDTLLILLAVGGISVVVLTVPGVKTGMTVVGALFLVYIGWITWSSEGVTQDTSGSSTPGSLGRQILFTMSISLMNPHAILDTIGVIGTSSLSYTGEGKVAFTVACIFVSWVWFSTLAFTGRLMRSLDQRSSMLYLLNRVSAVIMWGSAAYLVRSILL